MESLKRQLRGIITRDCVKKGVRLEHINVGCDHAEHLLEQGENAAYAVKEGIAIAIGQQKFADYRKRSTIQYVA